MIPRPLSVDNIFSSGHDGIALQRGIYQNLLRIIHDLEWGDDPGLVYNRLPSFLSSLHLLNDDDKFSKEDALNEASLKACPLELSSAVSEILNDPQVMGNWLIAHTPKLRFVSVWDGAEDLDWHWDGPAGADFFFLIYLNQEPGWIGTEGGQLKVGRRSLEGNYLQVEASEVLELSSYEPASRTLVCCNNHNPQFVHKVVPLSTQRERTVLMVGFDMIRSSCRHKP